MLQRYRDSEELKESWRLKLQDAKSQYEAATAHYRAMLQQRPDGVPVTPDSALALARRAESEALAEYTRVLRVFIELTTGKAPEGAGL